MQQVEESQSDDEDDSVEQDSEEEDDDDDQEEEDDDDDKSGLDSNDDQDESQDEDDEEEDEDDEEDESGIDACVFHNYACNVSIFFHTNVSMLFVCCSYLQLKRKLQRNFSLRMWTRAEQFSSGLHFFSSQSYTCFHFA